MLERTHIAGGGVVIPFPVRKRPEKVFRIGDRVRLTKSNRTGVVTDVRPDFGVHQHDLYTVMLESGTITQAIIEFMEDAPR